MRFAHPQFLWLLLLVVPALIAFFWWAWRKNQQLAACFIEARLLPNLVAGFSPARRKLRLAALTVAVACLILALARPQWGFVWEEVKQRGLDIVIAVDVSKSMLAQDIAPNRLGRAQLAALDLISTARSDRLGLVAFAGSAFLQCPLTIDDAAFRHSVESLDVNSISDGGTALAEAIQTALTAFGDDDNFKVLVLLTDGEDHDSDAVAAAEKAAQQDLQIFTIGIGSTEGELLRISLPDGQSDYIRDEQGNVVKSRLNEDLLRQIAGATQRGFYLPLRGAKTMDTLYQEGLAPLPKSEGSEKLVKRYFERFHWPLAFAIVLLAGEMFFPERRRRPARAGRLKPAAATAVILLAGTFALSASPSSALREYKRGDYQDALKQYEELLKRNPNDPRLHYNAGTAAYRAEKFDEALKQFEKALSAQDLDLQQQAFYNRGNTHYWLGETTPDPNSRKEAWQKSIKDFESSLKLNPQDPDARFNQEFVKKRLEELQQQQQQQQQDQNQDQNQDQQQNQQNQPQQQNQQQQEQQQSEQQQQQQQQQNQQQDQKQQQQREAQEQKAPQPSDKDQQKQQAQAPKEGEREKDEKADEAASLGPMSPEQARQLLDSQLGEEKVLPMNPERRRDSNRPKRDW